jgi:micrococcal nuclease
MTLRIFLLVVVAANLFAADFTGKVVAITGGDTIKVMHGGAAERIRLWGIDCPESKQAFGTRAKQFTGDLAFGQSVTVCVRDIDRYKRIVVAEIILPNGRNLNHKPFGPGWRGWYQHYARRELILRDLEQKARAARRGLAGLWANPAPVPPWEWRKDRRAPAAGRDWR